MNILTELCQELHNWFDRDQEKWFGDVTVENHEISINGVRADLLEGQYFRIINSRLNDGVYQYPAEVLKDEAFRGAVWSMAIPPSVVALAEEIAEYNEQNAKIINSPYQSESFGGYSYTKASGSGSSSGKGNPSGWRQHFADDLDRWRKL